MVLYVLITTVLPYYLLIGLAIYELCPRYSLLINKLSTIDSFFIILAWPALPILNILLTGKLK